MSDFTTLTLRPGQVTLADLRTVLEGPVRGELGPDARERILAGHATVQAILDEDRTAYGINTGFGLLANTRIGAPDLEVLQRNLVLSHATGVGAPLDRDVTRLVLVLKILSLSQGHSGVRPRVVDARPWRGGCAPCRQRLPRFEVRAAPPVASILVDDRRAPPALKPDPRDIATPCPRPQNDHTFDASRQENV